MIDRNRLEDVHDLPKQARSRAGGVILPAQLLDDHHVLLLLQGIIRIQPGGNVLLLIAMKL